MPAHLSQHNRYDRNNRYDRIGPEEHGLHYDPVVILTVVVGILIGTLLVTTF